MVLNSSGLSGAELFESDTYTEVHAHIHARGRTDGWTGRHPHMRVNRHTTHIERN